MPEFTIFTCTYQNADYIKRCYYSILTQNQTDWEWLIIDDGSTDQTEFIVRSISDYRIVYKRLDVNQGRGVARNYGLQYIRGSWVVILDMDDLMLPQRLDYVREAIEGGYDFMISEVALISNDLLCEAIRPAMYQRGIKIFTHATLCCRTEVFQKVGYFKSRYSEDQRIIIEFAFKPNCLVINEPLYLYQESATQSLKGARLANITAFKLLLKFLIDNKNYRSVRMFYYLFGFFARYVIISLSLPFMGKYDLFVNNRIKSNVDQGKVDKVNSFIISLKEANINFKSNCLSCE